jgi:hypothetical protein
MIERDMYITSSIVYSFFAVPPGSANTLLLSLCIVVLFIEVGHVGDFVEDSCVLRPIGTVVFTFLVEDSVQVSVQHGAIVWSHRCL